VTPVKRRVIIEIIEMTEDLVVVVVGEDFLIGGIEIDNTKMTEKLIILKAMNGVMFGRTEGMMIMIIGNVMTEEVRMVEVPVDLHLEENLQGEAEVRIRYFLHNITNHIGGIMVSELVLSAVDCGFEP
jgi:hypothetical protein